MVPRRRSPSACRRGRSSAGSCFTRRRPSAMPARVRCSRRGDAFAEQAAHVVRGAADRAARRVRRALAQRGAHLVVVGDRVDVLPARVAVAPVGTRVAEHQRRVREHRHVPAERRRARARPHATRRRDRSRRARRGSPRAAAPSSASASSASGEMLAVPGDLEPEPGARRLEALGVAPADRRLVEQHRRAREARARPCAAASTGGSSSSEPTW